MNVFVGMQATLMQPPPIIIGSRSIRAVLSLRLPRCIASVLPPLPPPMTMASYRSELCILGSGVYDLTMFHVALRGCTKFFVHASLESELDSGRRTLRWW